MNDITIKFCGGLGNQMFQYAAGRSLSLLKNSSLNFDISYYNIKSNDTQRDFQLFYFPNIQTNVSKIYNIKNSFLNKLRNHIVKFVYRQQYVDEPYFSYWEGFKKLNPPICINGYWQSEKYFFDFRDVIINDFKFPNLLTESSIKLEKLITQTHESVAVHVRRGDYISNPKAQKFHGNLLQNYYSKALNKIMKACGPTKLFIFSDDPDWVRLNFDSCGHSSIIIDFKNDTLPHNDMYLMTLCKHHIIANSSFSWWGAWLSQKKDGIVIAPKNWFANKTINTSDIYLKKWIKI